MPAVNPTRLQFQIEKLLDCFNTPPEFHRQCQHLFSHYANRSRHFGESTKARPLSPMYHLPRPVSRQLQLAIIAPVKEHPRMALALADELWSDSFLEIKQLAIYILGKVPVEDPHWIIDRLELWLTSNLDKSLLDDLFTNGAQQLQLNFPDMWESFIQSLLTQDNPKKVALGIGGLAAGVKQPAFQNIPAIFRLISPFIRNPHHSYIRELETLLEILIQYSPTETAYYLKQAQSVSEAPETVRLIKNVLPKFPEKIREDLKNALKK